MLSNFPGRTLEELDGINILRWFRAMDARNIETVEQTRKAQQGGKIKNKDLPKGAYQKFLEHDKMFKEFDEWLNGKRNTTDYPS